MPVWKPAQLVFLGGTKEIEKLKGRRVRTKTALTGAPVFDPIDPRKQATTDIDRNTIGLVTNPDPLQQGLLVAFPDQQTNIPKTVAQLIQGGRFKVVRINEPTFKQQFEIEV